MRRIAERYFGDKAFYHMVLLVAVPIMIQNGITNFVSLLDNIMVGRIGTEQMSGVAIVNQLIMVFNICIFGVVSGAGIFGAQFYGRGDHKGVRDTFRFKLVFGMIIGLLWILIFCMAQDTLIMHFLHGEDSVGDIEKTFRYGKEYLWIILIGLIPSVLTQSYASTLRETGETILPMRAGICAVITNLCLDYILIFGVGPIPELGVCGAAIATDIARGVECMIIIIYTHGHAGKHPFVQGLYQNFKIPGHLIAEIAKKGTPLLLNETLWSIGMATLTQCYSTRGLAVVAGLNISTTVSNLFNVVFIALGSAISIIVGQLLGAGKLEEAVDTDRKMITFSVLCCFGIGMIMFFVAPAFPNIYNTSDEVRGIATELIRVASLCMPMYAFMHATYFTMRSGGKTIVTFLFDSVYVWVVDIPLAMILTRFTDLPILPIYVSCQLIELVKCVIGYILVKKQVWVNNITN